VERRPLVAGALLLSLLVPAIAPAAVVSMSVDRPGCTGYTSGTGSCEAGSGTAVSVTWSLQTQESLNGYQLQIRWDPGELALTGAEQLYPDTGTPVAFTSEPSDPNASVASAFVLPSPAATMQLFRLHFAATPTGSDGQADLSWFAQGAGLSPASVVLENPGGAGIDFVPSGEPVPVPVAGRRGLFALALGILLAAAAGPGGALVRARRGHPPRGSGPRSAG